MTPTTAAPRRPSSAATWVVAGRATVVSPPTPCTGTKGTGALPRSELGSLRIEQARGRVGRRRRDPVAPGRLRLVQRPVGASHRVGGTVAGFVHGDPGAERDDR